jgi:hypothetical protein
MILIALLTLALTAGAQEIPAGTHISVRTGSSLSSGTSSVGQGWQGTLARDITVNGKTIARSGATVHGKVTYVKNSGRLHVPGQITVRLTSVETKDGNQLVTTSAVSRKGASHTKSNATKIGGGAAAGALIGGLVGGGKGALIGAGAGAGAGTGVAVATGKKEAVIPAESMLSFTTTAASRRR